MALLGIFVAQPSAGQPKPGENPIARDLFTADPAPMVYKDTVYLYTGHDEAKGSEMFTMKDWLCFSSKDMRTWTAHGPIMKVSDFHWAERDAWASQAVERDGKFYFYAAVRHGQPHPGMAIGVAVSESPTGPFVDARGSALITDDMTPSPNPWDDIDPTVFIDDDGTAWLCWGNPNCYLVRLKANMIELDGPIEKIRVPNYTEGPWLHKRGSLYYLTYAAFAHQGMWEKICYATAPRMTGPWTYRGILTEQAKNSYTIHPGIAEFKGQWYFFYHNAALTLTNGEKGGLGRRAVCVEHLQYNEDGTMRFIEQTTEGVSVPPKENAASAMGRGNAAGSGEGAAASDAGVTVTWNTSDDPTNWPGRPVVATVQNPYRMAVEGVSFNRGRGVTNLSQTFRLEADCLVQRITLFAGDGLGTAPERPVILGVYDLGELNSVSLTNYSVSTNLLGSGRGLRVGYAPQAAGLLSFEFSPENQARLKAGHAYAFELQGARNSAPLFWRRSRKGILPQGSAFADRRLLNEKAEPVDFALAIYGARE
jgi:hypothetical protein